MSGLFRALNVNSIRTRLTLFFLLFGVLPALVILAVYYSFKGSIEQAYHAPMQDTAVALGEVIDRNLFERYGDVQAFGANTAAWAPENWKNPTADNQLILAMNAYMTNYGIYRLMMLVDPQGSVLAVNSVDPLGKSLDTTALYRQNFSDASWFKRAIAGEFLKGKNGLTGTVVEQPDFNRTVGSIYGSDGFSMAFAAPVRNAAGERIGIWVNFVDFGLVEEIVAAFYKGMADRRLGSGEIAILDPQGKVLVNFDPTEQGTEYRRDPRVVGQLNLATEGVPAAVAAVKGETGVLLATHAQKNIEQVAGFAHTKGAYAYPGLGWSVLVRIAESEINTVANEAALYMEMAIVVSIAFISCFAFFITRGIAGSIAGMTVAMRELAGGNKSIDVPSLDRRDEIGGMAAALQVFKEAAVEHDKMMAQKEVERKIADEKARTMAAVTARFQANIGQLVSSVSSASAQLHATAQGLTNNAEQTNQNTSAVASASEEAAANVQTIAASAEELSASIGEISRQVNDAAEFSAKAVESARTTDQTVQGLTDAAQKIGKVVELINDIASQTNLLALNATIEAARAGEAGKGFAVVASEVKNLANQTARATDDISAQINAMQSVTKDAVSAIRDIARSIEKINHISTAIASAVEEQGAATKEIARSVEQAASGTMEVTRNVVGVSAAVSQTSEAAGEVFGATRLLSKSAGDMKAEIDEFLTKVRQA